MTKVKFLTNSVLPLLLLFGTAQANSNDIDPVIDAEKQSVQLSQAEVVSRYGDVVDSKPVGIGGLTAWTVEKGGNKVVLYTTKDGQALFTGVVWDARTGRNISDFFLPSNVPIKPSNRVEGDQEVTAKATFAFDGEFTGSIPESMKTVDSLAGFKEGVGGIDETLYIIIDPRCPYCRRAYDITRDYVAKGYSIKWIPTVALGDPENGIPLAATLLQSQDSEVIERILSKHERITTQPTTETVDSLNTSLSFMFAAFEQNGGQPGVPVAFFIDRRTGKPRMMSGVSEMVVIEDILGKL